MPGLPTLYIRTSTVQVVGTYVPGIVHTPGKLVCTLSLSHVHVVLKTTLLAIPYVFLHDGIYTYIPFSWSRVFICQS